MSNLLQPELTGSEKEIEIFVYGTNDTEKYKGIRLHAKSFDGKPMGIDLRRVYVREKPESCSKYNSIELLSDVIFELNELPDNYNDIADSILVPMARDSLLNSLDDILVTMGYNKMGLAKKMQ